MSNDYYESPVDVAQINEAAAAAAEGNHDLAAEARQGFEGHRRTLMRDIGGNVPRPAATQALERLRQLEGLLEVRIAQENQRVHDAAMRTLAEATQRQSKGLAIATWALVLATVVLAVATIASLVATNT